MKREVQDTEKNAKKAKVQVSKGGYRAERNSIGKERRRQREKKGSKEKDGNGTEKKV